MSQISPKQIQWSQGVSASLVPYVSGTLTASDYTLGDSSSYWGGLFVSGSGSVDIKGVISASVFSGDGSQLTGISAGGGGISFTNTDIVSSSAQISEFSLFVENDQDNVISGSLDISGSVTATSFVGDGSGLTNVSSDSIVGLNLSQIQTGSVSASVDTDGTIFLISSASNTLVSVDSSGNMTLEGNITAQEFFTEVVSASIIFESGSTIFGNSLDDNHRFTGSIHVSGSGDHSISGSINITTGNSSSTAITTNNITNGYPSSNNWKENLDGSYFNNFDANTHVSEILRFMAGVLSSSLDVADAQPNTKTFGSISTSHSQGSTTSKSSLLNGVLGSTYENARLSVDWTGSSFINFTQTASYQEVQDYLLHKNWMVSGDLGTYGNDTGTNPFHGSYASRIPSTIQTQGTFGTNSFTITANAAGSTDVSSNSNYFGLGTLTNGGATPYTVRIYASHSYSDSYDDQTPDENSTFTTQSLVDYTISDFGSSNGLILSKILTSQPAVIPSAFQDGDFNSVTGPISGRFYTGGATSATSLSASGYYKTHDIVTGLQTGSQSDYNEKNGSDSDTRFYLYTGGLPSDITSGAPTVEVTSSLTRTAFAATSRSLSGAPYLLTTTYSFTFDSEVSKSFDPAYGYASSVLVNSNPTNTWSSIGSTTLSNSTTTVTNGGVSSTGTNNYVITSDYGTKRTSSEIPKVDDIAVASSSFSFSLNSNSSNVGQNRTSNNNLNYNLSFRATGRNWKNSSQTSNTSTISFYDSTLFGQPSSSGSLAVYSRAQGYDSNTLQDTTETFTGEDFRIVLDNNVTSFSGTYFTTDSFQTNDNGDSVLGDYDLQVKPSYLVDPGGNYGYWFGSGFGSGTYKYYIRRFQKTSGTKTSMTINVGKTLVGWDSTTDGVAVGIVLKSGTSAGANTSISTCRIYDPSKTTDNLVEAGITTDNFKNPFTSNIDLYGNTGGSLASTTYTVPMRNADGMFLDDSDNELYIIIRYKGDPSPVTSITLGYS
jgi:hypothetical protein